MHDEFEFAPKAAMETSLIYGAGIRLSRDIIAQLGSILANPGVQAGIGGALGGLFGGEETSKISLPPQVMSALTGLLGIGQQGSPNLPTQTFSGLGTAEKSGLDLLQQFITSGPGATFEDAKSRITSFLDQSGDITQRPEFQSILKASGQQTNEAVNQVLRRIQLSGLSGSSPQGKAVGREVARGQQNLVGQLAPFAESERSRKFQALNQLLNIGQFESQRPLDQIGAAFQFGQVPRQIEDAQRAAQFSTFQQKALFPFREQADVFSRILGSQLSQPIVTDPARSTTFSNVLGGATGALKFGKLFGKAA